VAEALAPHLRSLGKRVEILDGDVVRTHLSKGLGFSKEDRDTNIQRIGFVAHMLQRNGVFVITAAISPYREVRDWVRNLADDFVEVYVNTPLEVCEQRDVKGLYKKARSGEIKQFTGISDPYEEPLSPEISLTTTDRSPDQCAELIVERLRALGYLTLALQITIIKPRRQRHIERCLLGFLSNLQVSSTKKRKRFIRSWLVGNRKLLKCLQC
jgi:adenylylsulfate kinase